MSPLQASGGKSLGDEASGSNAVTSVILSQSRMSGGDDSVARTDDEGSGAYRSEYSELSKYLIMF